MITARKPFFIGAFKICNIGIINDKVLPEPVGEQAIKSLFFNLYIYIKLVQTIYLLIKIKK